MNKLQGKRALITAGAQGIGLAISRQLIDAGCDVFVHYHSSAAGAAELAERAKKAGRRFGSGQADLTTSEASNALVAEAVKFLGGLDILVNNAGSMIGRRSMAEGDDEFWSDVMSLNVGSVRRVTRACVPHLIAGAKAGGGASIINLSSLAARNGGGPGALAYATAKGAVLTMTRGLAKELGPHGIRVNALTPGLILGSQFHAIHTPPEAQKAIIATIPLGRAGDIDDVARAAVYLASEYDGFITGAALDINGGVWGG
jgi:3-oxoacyl-[acyl-carrier protein] reductase